MRAPLRGAVVASAALRSAARALRPETALGRVLTGALIASLEADASGRRFWLRKSWPAGARGPTSTRAYPQLVRRGAVKLPPTRLEGGRPCSPSDEEITPPTRAKAPDIQWQPPPEEPLPVRT